ncbi:MAG: hypothetical protein ACTSYQ_02955, partial [Candidatus Odinarchaeia archaeon]
LPKIYCLICGKEIDEDSNKMICHDRYDIALPFEKSHFKHIHVTFYVCSKECENEYYKNREKYLSKIKS